MNSIYAKMTRTEYINCEHLMIFIDDIRFDKWLSNKLEVDYLGLIPTWLGWLNNPEEQEYVWMKTKMSEKEASIIPILVCPDDLDFTCSVIVCEVHYSNNTVQWKRIGRDITDFPDYIGKEIEWFQSIPQLEFQRDQYEVCFIEFVKYQKLQTE